MHISFNSFQANIINIVDDVLKQHVDIKLNDIWEKPWKDCLNII